MILKFDKLFLKSSSQYITNTIESGNVAILNFAEIIMKRQHFSEQFL